MPLLSVCVITLNEEANLARCLTSVSWADEIVVVDSGSTDRTAQIASAHKAKVVVRPFTDYADQKNYAIGLTSGDWVLVLDADEEAEPGLREEAARIVRGSSAFTAYRIRRRSRIFGRVFEACGTQDDKPVRLIRRGLARYEQPIHERMRVDGPVGDLKSCLRHHTYPTLSGYWQRLNRYTGLEAEWMARDFRPLRPSDMQIRPILVFVRLYLWKAGFRDGIQGFFFSVLSAYYFFLKHAKLRERLSR